MQTSIVLRRRVAQTQRGWNGCSFMEREWWQWKYRTEQHHRCYESSLKKVWVKNSKTAVLFMTVSDCITCNINKMPRLGGKIIVSSVSRWWVVHTEIVSLAMLQDVLRQQCVCVCTCVCWFVGEVTRSSRGHSLVNLSSGFCWLILSVLFYISKNLLILN